MSSRPIVHLQTTKPGGRQVYDEYCVKVLVAVTWVNAVEVSVVDTMEVRVMVGTKPKNWRF